MPSVWGLTSLALMSVGAGLCNAESTFEIPLLNVKCHLSFPYSSLNSTNVVLITIALVPLS